MKSTLMVLCGLVLLGVGTITQIASKAPGPSLTHPGIFNPGPPQVLLLGAVVLLFAAAIAQLEPD